MIRKWLLLWGTVYLSACATQPLPQQDTADSPLGRSVVRESLLAAHRQSALWNAGGNVANLVASKEMFARALEERPDDIGIQQAHYSRLMMLAMMDWFSWSQELARHFDSLHPVVRAQVPSPETVEYLVDEHRQPNSGSLALLVSAIEQQPNYYNNWYFLSDYWLTRERLWQALHAALRAHRLNPEHGDVNYRVGETYQALAERSGCACDRREMLKKAAQKMAASLQTAPDNSSYLVGLSDVYLHLGIIPLSVDTARKAFEAEANRQTTPIWANRLFLAGRMDEAEEQYRVVIQTYGNPGAHLGLVYTAIARGDWNAARARMALFRKSNGTSLRNALIDAWLDALGSPSAQADSAWAAVAVDGRFGGDQQLLVDYVMGDFMSTEVLLNATESRCDKARLHFYTAMKFWKADRREEALDHLHQVTAAGATALEEHHFAMAFAAALENAAPVAILR